ncbi:MAG TPA: hypothetical protein PK891_06445 [Bacteroidales bacterium]|nr:hypothetical protein [Bacteroidales bacterium]
MKLRRITPKINSCLSGSLRIRYILSDNSYIDYYGAYNEVQRQKAETVCHCKNGKCINSWTLKFDVPEEVTKLIKLAVEEQILENSAYRADRG